jgi:putative nucleotidyltransferase with HDIG domain
VVIVLLLGALGVGYDKLSVGTLVAFITLMLQLIWPIESLGVILAMAQEAMTAADRVLDIFDTRSSIVGGDIELDRATGHLRFEHVDFSYPDSDELVLEDVNLDVEPGETVAIVGATVAVDIHRAAQSRSLVGDFRAAELVAQEEAFLGARVRALTLRLAEKDESTEEHTRRVALRAVQLGEELGLSPNRLRSLAIGGLLHDIGKLSVPEQILKKPATLDESEFAVIKRHPEWGIKLLRELGGFSASVLELVHSHHERLDGNGYPRRLGEDDLGLDTRILTVCDVYDALVSPRVYRGAWNHEAALALLRKRDGDCVRRALRRGARACVAARAARAEHCPAADRGGLGVAYEVVNVHLTTHS